MTLKSTKLLFLAALFIISGYLLTVSVFAQDAVQPSESPSTPGILMDAEGTKDTHEEKIAELKTQYLAEVEAYRRAEQNFRVLKQQYLNLLTLKSLEEATVATKQAMYERSRVITTHLDLLYFTLLDTGGINLVYKNAQIKDLEARIEEMRQHTAKVEKSTTRDEINELRDDFKILGPKVEDTSYRGMALVSIGRHQTVYDQSRIILADLNSQILTATMSALKKTELERAFFETDRSLNEVKDDLIEINDGYAAKKEPVKKQFYSNILRDLGSIYAKLSQNLSYLEELLRL